MSSATKLKTPQPQNINGARGASTLSKKRFVEFEERVKSVLGECEEAEEIMSNSANGRIWTSVRRRSHQILPLAEFEESVAGRRKVGVSAEECRCKCGGMFGGSADET
jgi:hypothetical protein